MQIGGYKIIPIMTGLFRLDGGAMFGVVPKTLWEKTNPPDDRNRIAMCARGLLLDNGKKKILIDTGTGHKLPKKGCEIYALSFAEHSLLDSLTAAGYKREEITDVILTHLHFDHSGGNTFYDEEKQLQITFPNAEHYVQKNHYDWALNPSERDKASFFPNNYVPLMEKKQLNLVEGEFKFDEIISTMELNGHTRSMQVVKAADEKETLIFMADLIPMASHVPLPFIMGYDLFPLITLEEKRAYLTEGYENNWTFVMQHDPYTEAIKIGYEAEKFFVKEKVTL